MEVFLEFPTKSPPVIIQPQDVFFKQKHVLLKTGGGGRIGRCISTAAAEHLQNRA